MFPNAANTGGEVIEGRYAEAEEKDENGGSRGQQILVNQYLDNIVSLMLCDHKHHQQWALNDEGHVYNARTQWEIGGHLLGSDKVHKNTDCFYNKLVSHPAVACPDDAKEFIGAAKVCHYVVYRDYVQVPIDLEVNEFPLSSQRFKAVIWGTEYTFYNAKLLFQQIKNARKEKAVLDDGSHDMPSHDELQMIREIRGRTIQFVLKTIFHFLNCQCSLQVNDALLLAGYNCRSRRKATSR